MRKFSVGAVCVVAGSVVFGLGAADAGATPDPPASASCAARLGIDGLASFPRKGMPSLAQSTVCPGPT